MEYAVLGLLLREQLTIYQIRIIFAESFSLIYGDSYGSLQSALKRLLNQGFIRFEAVKEGGRNKKVYHITAAGRTRFVAWMGEEIPLSKLETATLTRLFFLGELEQADRLQVLANIQGTLAGYLERLHGIKEANAPHYALNIPWVTYRLAMLDYAIFEIGNSLQFFSKLSAQEQPAAQQKPGG